MPEKTTKVLARRRKFIDVEIPVIKTGIKILGNNVKEIENRTITLDLTRQLKGKSVEAVFRIKSENNEAIAYPIKIKLMPYFIRRMIRKNISYVEDSFHAPSQESLFIVKPFLITRKRVSRAVRKTLRNKAKNWLEDYLAERRDNEIFNEILLNKMQRPLSLILKKTYPLSLCEIRIIEIEKPLAPEEIPKRKEKKISLGIKKAREETIEEGLDQLKEIEEEKIKKAEEEIKKVQEKASEIEKLNKEQEKTKEKPEEKQEKAEKSAKLKKRGRPKKIKESKEEEIKKETEK